MAFSSFRYNEGLRSSLTWAALMTLVWLAATAAYNIGYGQMRYVEVAPAEPISSWTFWRFFIAGYFPDVIYGLTMYLLVSSAFTKKKPNRLLTYIVWFGSLLAIGWNVMFVIWEATTWANCDAGGNTLLPAHPECLNRKFPLEQQADWTFIIIVISGGVLCAPSIVAFWISQQVLNTALAANVFETQGDVEIGTYDEPIGHERRGGEHSGKKPNRPAHASTASDIGYGLHSATLW